MLSMHDDDDLDDEQPHRKRRRKRVIGKTAASAISNGTREFFIAGKPIDMRTQLARRYVDIRDNLQYELGYPVQLWQKSVIRQVASAAVALEQIQRSIVAGEKVDLENFVKLTGVTMRLYRQLGLKFPGAANGKVKRIDSFEEQIGGYHSPPDTK
jgi:hypothetical protein